ncbi:hypothetical protein FNV43_RR03599 [Rhamnella rubrinervis]|uniref:Uncharacterized protein n=1 Tax=Rhamnella rubrinervis TaxID=2594499 RepID=A0A8K0HI96_9ROSA|nr:hypothetical protein FNV43_RR03599 [Rhamnella rubrinervis]
MTSSVRNYKEKYYKGLMPLKVKYAVLLPWGGKLTSECLKFFSPIVLWTKFTSSQCNHDVLFSAFMDYYKAWLQLMKEATEEADPSGLNCNRVAEELPVFNGIDELGSKSSLDYFPSIVVKMGQQMRNGVWLASLSKVGLGIPTENSLWILKVFTLGLSWKAITKPPECSSQLSLLESIPAFAQRVVCWQIDSDDIYSPSKIFAFHSSFLSGFELEYVWPELAWLSLDDVRLISITH